MMRLEALRQVGVGVERDAVGPQLGHLGQCAVEGFGRLLGQAVNEVDIDRFEADAPRGGHQGEHLLGRLHPVHRLLHGGVEILHAEAEAVEAEPGQRLQPGFVDGAGIDLDRVFTAGHQAEVAPQHGHQFGQFLVVEEGGRAAPQMQLADRSAPAQVPDVQVDLAAQQLQVGCTALMVLGDDLVAGAVVAERLAEGDVHVDGQRQRQGRRPAAPLLERKLVVARAECFDEAVGRGIRGIARPGNVKTLQQLAGDGGHCQESSINALTVA